MPYRWHKTPVYNITRAYIKLVSKCKSNNANKSKESRDNNLRYNMTGNYFRQKLDFIN